MANSGLPVFVVAGVDSTPPPLANISASFTICEGAPTGTVTLKVSGGVTSTLSALAEGNVTGPEPLALVLNCRLPGLAPAATVHTQLYTTGSLMSAMLLSALTNVGPVVL